MNRANDLKGGMLVCKYDLLNYCCGFHLIVNHYQYQLALPLFEDGSV